ncbi:MAG: ROK family transcriptional regulator [Opitutaceae bacterium]|nr:ROK family transcriptional regulator [Opitutaceae bacterium]
MRLTRHRTADLESNILKHLRTYTDISRVDLARRLGLAPSTAGIYVERLIRQGYVKERNKVARKTGRPPTVLQLNPERGEFVGVDFDARNIMALAVDFSDKPLRNTQLEIAESDSIDQVLRKIEQAVEKVMPKDRSRLLAIGAGVPGLVDCKSGVAVHYEYIAQWKNIPLAQRLKKKFGVQVFIENTIRTMALAELWFGQGLGVKNFHCIGIRSGIAVGMIQDGQLYCGANRAAGELGRWRYPHLSPKVAGWFKGGAGANSSFGPELQEIASVRAIQRALDQAISDGQQTLLRSSLRPIPIEDVLRAVQQRDPLALQIVGEVARGLGWAIGQLILTNDPAKIMLAGPLTALGDHILQPVRLTIDSLTSAEGHRNVEIVHSTMGEFIGALGAAALALHEWKPMHVTGGRGASRSGRRKVGR